MSSLGLFEYAYFGTSPWEISKSNVYITVNKVHVYMNIPLNDRFRPFLPWRLLSIIRITIKHMNTERLKVEQPLRKTEDKDQ